MTPMIITIAVKKATMSIAIIPKNVNRFLSLSISSIINNLIERRNVHNPKSNFIVKL